MQFNGSTSTDRTNYFESFTANPQSLDWALAMEADRMVNSYIRRSDLDTEMTVVRNEFESGENNPQLVLLGKMLASSYQWHNYAHLPIGARSDIENVNIERLQAFYRTYYQPDNAVLIVAGKFDVDTTLSAIAKYFGPIPKPSRKLPTIYTVDPVQDGERTVTLRRAGNSKYLGMMFHTVRGAHPDYVATDVLGDVLDGRARGKAVQVAGGNQEGVVRGELGRSAARPRLADAVRADPGRRRHRTRARRDVRYHRGPEEESDHRRRSRADQACARPSTSTK